MSIIFYEEQYAKDLIINGSDSLSRRDLNYIAKYWDSLGFSEKDIESNLIAYCKGVDPNFNVIQNYDFYHRATIHARNNMLRTPLPIKITESELQSIQSISDVDGVSAYKIQKFIFIMLVVSKFFKYHQSRKRIKESKYDQYLYSNASIKDLKNLAQVNFTQKQWKLIKHNLTVKSLINPTIVGSKKWVVALWNEISPMAMYIDDYRNPIAYYQRFCGESMIECAECGTAISRRSSSHSYCRDCWIEKRKELWRENSKKYRNRRKSS